MHRLLPTLCLMVMVLGSQAAFGQWEELKQFPNRGTRMTAIGQSDSVVYYATQSGLYRSVKGKKTNNLISGIDYGDTERLPLLRGFFGSSTGMPRLLVDGDTIITTFNNNLRYSTDQGQQWRGLTVPDTIRRYNKDVSEFYYADGRLYLVAKDEVWKSGVGIYSTPDFGKTWRTDAIYRDRYTRKKTHYQVNKTLIGYVKKVENPKTLYLKRGG